MTLISKHCVDEDGSGAINDILHACWFLSKKKKKKKRACTMGVYVSSQYV